MRSAGIAVTVVTLLSLALMQASAAGFSYWLSYWATQQVNICCCGLKHPSEHFRAKSRAAALVQYVRGLGREREKSLSL